MNVDQRIKAFATLGQFFRSISEDDLQTLAMETRNQNPWFAAESVRLAISNLSRTLTAEALLEWIKSYPLPKETKTVAIVAAGNIPFVGFHDLMCVLLAGHRALIKLSSKDAFLMNFVIEKLKTIEDGFADRVIVAEQLKNFDAVIATGSDNTSRYFEYYFGKYPHIIRKNRTSVGILDGNEDPETLAALGFDVFSYFGLGCRNVSKLFVPMDFRFDQLFPAWEKYQPIIHHHKYCNNYDYQKAILLVNQQPFLDNGFVLVQESDRLVSPISVVYFERYSDLTQLRERLSTVQDKIQVIEGNQSVCDVPFGKSQQPQLEDYADKVDTMKFLSGLN
jgi:hypothetical protein